MGILTRFTDIMKSNINALLDKCEDPAKMIDQTLRDLREDLAEVKKETANIIADAKSADRQVQECEDKIAKYITFLHKEKAGLQLIFNKYSEIDQKWEGWKPRTVNSSGQLEYLDCNK